VTSATSFDNSLSDMYRSPPRPLPYDAEPLNSTDKWNECAREDELKIYRSKFALRLSSAKYTHGVGLVYTSSLEEEDICPICLEEYTKENPKIMTKCSHHFHLSCIYEWMERSDNCPVCGKEMEFDETIYS
jgi:hypothetical protein